MQPQELSFEDIDIGNVASYKRTITETDIHDFSNLSGDINPLHLNKAYAKTTIFERPIAHGMLLGSFCSTLIGVYLPGKYALYLSQSIAFKKPVYAGDTIITKGTIISTSQSTHIIHINIELLREDEIVANGIAVVRVLK